MSAFALKLLALLSMVCDHTALVLLYNGKRGPNDHRLFYWAYPAHLCVLLAVSVLLGSPL